MCDARDELLKRVHGVLVGLTEIHRDTHDLVGELIKDIEIVYSELVPPTSLMMDMQVAVDADGRLIDVHNLVLEKEQCVFTFTGGMAEEHAEVVAAAMVLRIVWRGYTDTTIILKGYESCVPIGHPDGRWSVTIQGSDGICWL